MDTESGDPAPPSDPASDSTGIEFCMGQVFPAGNHLARFVVSLAMVHNDITLAMKHSTAKDDPDAESVYFFRLLAAHVWEAWKLVQKACERWDDVRAFLQGLDPTVASFVGETEPHRRPGAEVIKRFRNSLFHYPEPLDGKADERGALRNALVECADQCGRIYAPGQSADLRYEFAHDVALTIALGNADCDQPIEVVRDSAIAVRAFCSEVISAYLASPPAGDMGRATGP